jgi:hypothetical protein
VKQDTYHDYITGLEVVMGDRCPHAVREQLIVRAGCRPEEVHVSHPYNVDAAVFSVRFDSSRWTGR